MRICQIKSNNLAFQRKPTKEERQKGSKAIKEGLRILGKDKLTLITHTAPLPNETGIGTPFSKNTIDNFCKFVSDFGFNSLQLDPIQDREISPYSPVLSTLNENLLPLDSLVEQGLLSEKTYNTIVENAPEGDVNFNYVSKSRDKALKEAFSNYIQTDGNYEELLEIANCDKDIEQNAIYYILSKNVYHNNNWESWSDIDKTLYCPDEQTKKQAQKRISELKSKNKDEIAFFVFKQNILADEIIKAQQELREKCDMELIGDIPVALPKAQEWANQKYFLKDKALGCPPDYFSKDGQRWGFRFFDPQYIFNEDGSLGPAGEIMKEKYKKAFLSTNGGIRIDHLIGLIDPFIYSTNESKMTPQNSGRIYSDDKSPYKKETEEQYAQILEKIVFPAAEESGVKLDTIICEDLGTVTEPTKKVIKRLNLKGINVLEFGYSAKNAKENSIIMLGSHDNASFIEFTQNLFANKNNDNFKFLIKQTAEENCRPNTSSKKRKHKKQALKNSPKKFKEALCQNLFASPAKSVQIFFTDLFGINRTYNTPGTSPENNWKLRIPENYEDYYINSLEKGEGINIPKAIAEAIKIQGKDKNPKNKKVLSELRKYSKILEEKTEK